MRSRPFTRFLGTSLPKRVGPCRTVYSLGFGPCPLTRLVNDTCRPYSGFWGVQSVHALLSYSRHTSYTSQTIHGPSVTHK